MENNLAGRALMYVLRLFEFLGYVFGFIAHLFDNKQELSDIRAIDNTNKVMVLGRDNVMVSIIEVYGNYETVSASISESTKEKINKQIVELAAIFNGVETGTQFFDWSYEYDPHLQMDRVNPSLKEGLAHSDLDKEQIRSEKKLIESICGQEKNYIAIYTPPRSYLMQDTQITRQKSYLQDHYQFSEKLLQYHFTKVKEIVNKLREGGGLYVELIEPSQYLESIYHSLHHISGFSIRTYEDAFLNYPQSANSFGDKKGLALPSFSEQFFNREVVSVGVNRIKIGEFYHQPMALYLAPDELVNMQQLVHNLQDKATFAMPYRITYRLEEGGLSTYFVKKNLVNLLKWPIFSPSNNKLHRAFQDLENYYHETGEVPIRLKIIIDTWAKDEENLTAQVNHLHQVMFGWGHSQMTNYSGNPQNLLVSSLPGLKLHNEVQAFTPVLKQAFFLLPYTRPVNAWKQGGLVFTTKDGKVMPVSSYAKDVQSREVRAVVGAMGSGKSTFLSNLGLAVQAEHGNVYTGIIDIGGSLRAIVDNIVARYQDPLAGVYEKLSLQGKNYMNPLDTLLGLEAPLPRQYDVLISILEHICTPPGEYKLVDGITGLLNRLLKITYKQYSIEENPKLFNEYVIPDITEFLKRRQDELLKENVDIDKIISWHKIRDILFSYGEKELALIAHAQAMPTLSDVVAMLSKDETIKGNYADDLIRLVRRNLNDAIEQYSIFFKHQSTYFIPEQAKAVGFDLDEVAPKGGAAQEKQAALMYMMALYFIQRSVNVTATDLAKIPKRYAEYYKRYITEKTSMIKDLYIDELGRIRGNRVVANIFVPMILEGRKNNLGLTFSSQQLDHMLFDKIGREGHGTNSIVDLISSFYILSAGDEAIKQYNSELGLEGNAHAQHILREELRLPTPETGSNVLTIHRTSLVKRDIIQHVRLRLTPYRSWSITTHAEDRTLKDIIFRTLRPEEAYKVLAFLYPEGTITKRLKEENKRAMLYNERLNKAKFLEDVAERVVKYANEVRSTV